MAGASAVGMDLDTAAASSTLAGNTPLDTIALAAATACIPYSSAIAAESATAASSNPD